MELTNDMIVYMVKWKNYDEEYNTWEPVENLGNCSKRRTEFETMKTVLMQHTAEDIEAVLNKFRNKKGELTDLHEPSTTEVNRTVTQFLSNRKLLNSRQDFQYARMRPTQATDNSLTYAERNLFTTLQPRRRRCLQ
uniref:Chromo domain-containing protein n=1 Tax=Cacopsylla melanoneura TaxID=428564 RepID=A0A8D9EE27_9HEMI